MHIIFESRDANASQLREPSLERVRFALRRLSSLVPRARVQFSDVNGPRGGVDKRCQVELSTEGAGAAPSWHFESFHRARAAVAPAPLMNPKK